jgi:protein-disulfide isomerase
MRQKTATARLTLPVSKRDHILGPETAAVTLVEYGDYECPYCGQAHPIVKELLRRLRDQLRFAYRHFPLTQVHPHAEQAAQAAEAAGRQGKFWEMHDTLFENQDALDDVDLVRYAMALGLDRSKFIQDMNDPAVIERIREDVYSGIQSGVNGTPTFFINGVRHDGSYDLDTLLAAIEDAMAS